MGPCQGETVKLTFACVLHSNSSTSQEASQLGAERQCQLTQYRWVNAGLTSDGVLTLYVPAYFLHLAFKMASITGCCSASCSGVLLGRSNSNCHQHTRDQLAH